MRREVKVKICGITRRIDAVYAAELGAYAIGFILVPQTIRRVEIDEISRLIYGLKNIIKVGVVANQSLNEIISLFKSSPLEMIQLHGEESPSFCQRLRDLLPSKIKIIKTFFWHTLDLHSISAYKHKIDAVLIDLPKDKKIQVNVYDKIRMIKEIKKEFPRLFLAGNLNSNNVKKIIDVFSPWGVDVASGVESSPGIKNFYLMKDFIEKTGCV